MSRILKWCLSGQTAPSPRPTRRKKGQRYNVYCSDRSPQTKFRVRSFIGQWQKYGKHYDVVSGMDFQDRRSAH
jgi:hypothetical protein